MNSSFSSIDNFGWMAFALLALITVVLAFVGATTCFLLGQYWAGVAVIALAVTVIVATVLIDWGAGWLFSADG